MTTLGRRWFAAFYVYVQHVFIASIIASFSTTPARLLRQPRTAIGDIPNRYTSDVVLNQQARVAHGGGMADCLPGGPVAGKPMTVQDAGAYGGSGDKPMAGCLVVHDIV
jgi:hypothetical protein